MPSGTERTILLWICGLEMSGEVKPLTSFLIEDILAFKDSTKVKNKWCLQKIDRCSQWKEEFEQFSEQHCSSNAAVDMQTGESLQK